MNQNLALLQFVALALPALAILMQAVVSIHNKQDDGNVDNPAIYSEFRFLEFAFLFLVVASLFFCYSLLGRIEDTATKMGIYFLLGGLVLIVPATWFSLRRETYANSKYETPEKAVLSAAYTLVKLSPILIIGIGVYMVIYQLPDTQVNLDYLIAISTNITIGMTVVFVLFSTVNLLNNMFAGEYEKKWQSKIINKLEATKELLNNEVQIDQDRVPESYIKRIKENVADLVVLEKSAPDWIDDGFTESLNDLTYDLDNLAQQMSKLYELINQKEEIEKDLSLLKNEASSLQIDTNSLENPDQPKSNQRENILNRINQLENEIDDLDQDIDNKTHDIEQMRGKISNDCSSLIDDIESADKNLLSRISNNFK